MGSLFLRPVGTGFAASSAKLVIPLQYFTSISIGDIVTPDADNDLGIIPITNNQDIEKILGIISWKDDDNNCDVMIKGLFEEIDFDNIARGDRVYIGDDGKPNNAPPNIGSIKEIGYGFKAKQICVNFDKERIENIWPAIIALG